MKVCQKVEEKHVTSYNEVADELVREFVTMRPNDSVRLRMTALVVFLLTNHFCVQQAYDEKNIRRRVYDALNVLMAMDIISKERKEIRWKGLPSSLQHDTEMLLVRHVYNSDWLSWTDVLRSCIDGKKRAFKERGAKEAASSGFVSSGKMKKQQFVLVDGPSSSYVALNCHSKWQ